MRVVCIPGPSISFTVAREGSHPKAPDGTRILWKEAAAVAILLGLLTTGRYAGAAVMGALIVWACFGTRNALQSLTFSVLVVMINQDLTGEQSMIGISKWLLICVALVRVLADRRYRPATRPVWAIWLGLFLFIALGLIFVENRDPLLSLMKLTTFSAGALAALIGIRDQRYPPQYWLNWLTTVYAVVLVLSAPLLFAPAGYVPRTPWFRGIMTHSQSFGIYIAPLAVYLAVKLFQAPRAAIFPLTGLAAYSLFVTGSRTAFLAAGTALAVTIVELTFFLRGRREKSGNRYLVPLLCAAGALLVILVGVGGAALGDNLLDFATKGQWDLSAPVLSKTGLGSSRLLQVNQLMSSIAEYPIFGIGFGMAPAEAGQIVVRDESTGLPTGSPTEQGFLPLAVLAQVGTVGAAALLVFVVALLYPVVKCSDPAIVALFWTAVMVNFGEMVFFAIGGLGMQMWLLMALCHEAGTAQLKRAIP